MHAHCPVSASEDQHQVKVTSVAVTSYTEPDPCTVPPTAEGLTLRPSCLLPVTARIDRHSICLVLYNEDGSAGTRAVLSLCSESMISTALPASLCQGSSSQALPGVFLVAETLPKERRPPVAGKAA